MSSPRRHAASRANGKKSQGPVTPEGKARSAAGAPTRLGGRSVFLKHENRDGFLLLHDTLVTKHAPVTFTEHLTVHEMAVVRWRLQRAWLMETALVANQMDHMMGEIDKTYESTCRASCRAWRRCPRQSAAPLTMVSPSMACRMDLSPIHLEQKM